MSKRSRRLGRIAAASLAALLCGPGGATAADATFPAQVENDDPIDDGEDLPDAPLPDQDLPSDQLPDDDLPDQDVPSGDLPDRDLPDQDLPRGNLPDRELPDGDLPRGDDL
jgi:hypothetical protein